jgi:hypothetical protein
MAKTQSNHFWNNPILSNVLLTLLTIILALMVLTQANPGLTIANLDYGNYAYIGQQITLGKLPYRDAWESKPPAIFYVDALGLWATHGLRWGIWFIEFLCLFAAVWLSYVLIKKLWGILPALFGIAVWLYGFNITLQGGNTTEEFPLPLHFLALILFLRLSDSPDNALDGFLIGIAFSISFLFRANNAMVETVIVLTLLLIWIVQRNFRAMFRQLIWMAIGALIPLLITAGYFWKQGIFKPMFEASITYNLLYSGTKLKGTLGILAGFQNLGFAAWIGWIGFSMVLILLIKEWRAKSKASAILILLLMGCPFAVVATDPAQRNYAHYFINWLPFIALLSGLTFYTIQSLTPKFKDLKLAEPYYLGLALLAIMLVFVLRGAADKNYETFINLLTRTNVERQSVIANYIESNTKPGDPVLIWGGFTDINFMSHRASPTAYVLYPLLLSSSLSEQYSHQFMVDIREHQPVLIVDMNRTNVPSIEPHRRATQNRLWPYLPENINAVLIFINSHYRFDTTLGGMTIYRLDDISAP